MRQKIHIINKTVDASEYGIGTYLEQLISCLKKTDTDFDMIHLHTENSEVSIMDKNGYKQIFIPSVKVAITPKNQKFYLKNVVYLLKILLPMDKEVQHVFHLNYMGEPELIFYLKKIFDCKIVLVLHYTDWSFMLSGNEKKLHSIMKNGGSTIEEKYIYQNVQNDLEMINTCDKLICVARHSLGPLMKYLHIDANKYNVIHNALADSYKPMSVQQKERFRKKYGMNPEDQILLFAGRLEQVKGVSFLIEAFIKVAQNYPHLYLIIAGNGNLENWISQSKKNLKRIIFTGRLEKKELYDLYKIADIGVVCSLHEEFGYVAIEMMMHALPLIASDTGGLSEIVTDTITGLKVSVRTKGNKRIIEIPELVDKIHFLLGNPDLAKNRQRRKKEISGNL